MLAQKFEELRRNRFTAPEDELKQAQELALANSETQQAMINELTARIHGLNDMTEEGASDILRLLTREETDGRFRDVKNNLMQKESELKDALTKVQELTDQGKYSITCHPLTTKEILQSLRCSLISPPKRITSSRSKNGAAFSADSRPLI